MCYGAEAAWVPAVVAAAGAGVSAVDQQRALKRQDAETARGIKTRALLQQEAGKRVQDQIQEVAKSTPDMERKQQNDAFLTALRNAKVADGGENFGPAGAASERFAADVSGARTRAGAEGAALSGQLADIDAPGLQRQREARGFSNAATDLDMIADRGRGLDFLTELRAQQVGRTNPWVQGLGQGLQAFGSAYAGRMQPAGANPNSIIAKRARYAAGNFGGM